MNSLFLRILKYLRNIFIIVAIAVVVDLIIFYFKGFKLSEIFIYTGVAFMALGGISLLGNMGGSSSSSYVISRSASSRSNYTNSRSDLSSKDNSFNFLIFMTLSGLVLIAISYLV